MELKREEIELLRALAQEYAELAARPENDEKRRLWRLHNDGRAERPMVVIDQIPWNEVDPEGFLTTRVREPWWQGVELWLRKSILQAKNFPADQVLTPYVQLPRCISGMGYAEYGIEIRRETRKSDPRGDVSASRFTNQLLEPEDVEKIQAPPVLCDREKEREIAQLADRVFEGILPWEWVGVGMHCGLWDFIAHWMGVEAIYVDLMDRPEFIHAIMEKTTRETIRKIDALNALGAFDVRSHVTHCSYTYSSELPQEDADPTRARSADTWTMGMAQLFTSVSPAITREFEIPYMQRIFKYFGGVYYGCCDRLDDRLELVEQLPNVKKISCSPWSDRDRFAERMDRKYIMSAKPNPALIAGESVDWELVRQDLQHTLDAAKRNGKRLELLLKDISTVRYDANRLRKWSELALGLV